MKTFCRNMPPVVSCKVCLKTFSTQNILRRHNRIKHMPFDKVLCHLCGGSFTRKGDLNVHINACHKTFECKHCEKLFDTKILFEQHVKGHNYTCDFCKENFPRKKMLRRHIAYHLAEMKETQESKKDLKNKRERTALKGTTTFVRWYNKEFSDVLPYVNYQKDFVKEKVIPKIKEGLKWNIVITVEFVKQTSEGLAISKPAFCSKFKILLNIRDFDEQYQESLDQIMIAFEKYQKEGSNWTLNKILFFDLKIVKYDPLRGSSYIELPKKISGKRGVINIQNTSDHKCFLYSVLAALHPTKDHPNRVKNYIPYENEINMKGISYPVKIQEITKFENLNNISVNVLGFEINKDGELIFFPVRLTKLRDTRKHVNLLRIF